MTAHPGPDHEAAGDEELLVRNWRVARLTGLGIPGPLAEVDADHLDWHQVARLGAARLPPRRSHHPLNARRVPDLAVAGLQVSAWAWTRREATASASGGHRQRSAAEVRERRHQHPSVAHRDQLRHAGLSLAEEQPYRVSRCRGGEVPVGFQRGLPARRLACRKAALTSRMCTEVGCLAPARRG